MMPRVIRTMQDLERVLERLPVTSTPPYFAEASNKEAVHIITGAANSFAPDAVKESDNPWNAQDWDDRWESLGDLKKKVADEIRALQECFVRAGFSNVHCLPVEVNGLISWVFINNAMSAGFTRDGDPLMYFGRMKNAVRWPEPSLVEFYLQERWLLRDVEVARASTFTMEGKGDQLPMSLPVIEEGTQSQNKFYHAVINCSGRRTHPLALEEFAAKSGNYVIEVPLSDEPHVGAYHGNVAIMYVHKADGNRGVVYVPDMLDVRGRDFVYTMFKTFFGKEHVHRITRQQKDLFEEATRQLSMNGISLGQGVVISGAHQQYTNKFFEEDLGLCVIRLDMQGIREGGGGLQCCYTALNKSPLVMPGKRAEETA